MTSSAARWRLLVRPAGQRPRAVVERDEEELVGFVEQREEEAAHGGAGVRDALAVHAVADVEQQAQTDRDALVRERRHVLLLAVLVDCERLAWQTGDEMAFLVRDRGRKAGQLDAGRERPRIAYRRLALRRSERARQDDRQAHGHRILCPHQSSVLSRFKPI